MCLQMTDESKEHEHILTVREFVFQQGVHGSK